MPKFSSESEHVHGNIAQNVEMKASVMIVVVSESTRSTNLIKYDGDDSTMPPPASAVAKAEAPHGEELL